MSLIDFLTVILLILLLGSTVSICVSLYGLRRFLKGFMEELDKK